MSARSAIVACRYVSQRVGDMLVRFVLLFCYTALLASPRPSSGILGPLIPASGASPREIDRNRAAVFAHPVSAYIPFRCIVLMPFILRLVSFVFESLRIV